MSDEDALIAGIREHPLDDLRRLVYTDWLDERGRSAEAEYLRLVAALADTGAPVDVEHPHAVRLLALANELDECWREELGSRFEVWIEPPLDRARLINFIKTAREISGLGIGELQAFCYALPKMLSGGLPLEEAVGQVQALHQSAPRYRILPVSEVHSQRPLRRDIVLCWQADFQHGRLVTTAEQTRAALTHLRQILARTPETTSLSGSLPEMTEQADWRVTLATAQLPSEIARWRKRLRVDDSFCGDTADPPFSGWIRVQAVSS